MRFDLGQWLFDSNYETSIMRRAFVLCFFIGPAFIANLLVYFFCSRLLPPSDFGVFYIAITVENTLFFGSLILNTTFTRYLVNIAGNNSGAALFGEWFGLERLVAIWGAVAAIVIFGVLLVIGRVTGIQSWLILFLIVVDTYIAYVADLGRVLLQSVRKTAVLGLYGLSWMVLRFGLCVTAVAVSGTVWAAFVGSILATLLVIGGFHLWLGPVSRADRAVVRLLPMLFSMVPIGLGYGTLITISNLDALIGFYLLSPGDYGIYSASSVLPKGMLVVTVPILQFLFALTAVERVSGRAFRVAAGKSGAITFGLAFAGVACLWLTSDWSCGGAWGLQLCRNNTFHVLLLSVVPLSLLRILVLLDFARGRDWHVFVLAVPVALYLWIAFISPHTIDLIADQFSAFSAICFVILLSFVAIEALVTRRQHFLNASEP